MSNAVIPATPSAAPADLVELGRVAAAYGVKGWIKIQPHSADADVLLSVASAASAKSSSSSGVMSSGSASYGSRSYGSTSSEATSAASSPVAIWWLSRSVSPGAAGTSGKASPARPYAIKAARPHGSHIVAQLDGIDDRDQAEALRGMRVCVSRSAFPAPDEDEYYWVDLIGCTVFGEENGATALLGVVDEVLDNGAHAVLKILRQHGSGQEPGADAPRSDLAEQSANTPHPDQTGRNASTPHSEPAGRSASTSHSDPAGQRTNVSRAGPQGLSAELMLDAKGRPIEVLVPFVQAHIRAVDLANRRIDSDWPLDF